MRKRKAVKEKSTELLHNTNTAALAKPRNTRSLEKGIQQKSSVRPECF
jgi:hypothetical protein